ncbi:jg1389 [Pararge aegeria aegeria]|uniref:Jg1389 protein n=1 Tax=Pararge aegeria aegeria TaxID=348720 RepID=A0A8S4QRA5_9NEOP|nr:jg1389 [Pararge aegeria aegeria]
MGSENTHAASETSLHRFWSELLPEMKHGFITLSLNPNKSPCNECMHKKGTPPSKKFKALESAGKLMETVFWDCEEILLIDYKEKGRTITGEYYATILGKLKESIKEKHQGKLTKGVLLLQDNAPVHKSRVAMAALLTHGFESLIHPPYSPDLAPSDFYLFPNLKKDLKGRKFSDENEDNNEGGNFGSFCGKRKNIFTTV